MKASERKCMQASLGLGRYCGRISSPIVSISEVTCEDCLAACRADMRAEKASGDAGEPLAQCEVGQ